MARRLRVNPFFDSADERDVGLEVHAGEPAPEATTDDPAVAIGEAMEALGQVAGAYIACRSGGDLLLVDQHRAAERIIADELASKDHTVARQMLMLPMTLELTDAEQTAVDEHREALGEAGFEIEPFGGSGYLVRSVPASLAERGPEEALRGIIEELAEWGKSDQGDARERLIATIACHGAIKSGEHLSEREMRHLIRQLDRSSTPAICPHGDPIIVSISRAELDRRFGRSYRDSE